MKQYIKTWLATETVTWERDGLVSTDQAEQIRARYTLDDNDRTPLAVKIFGALGSLLIGAGIMLLFAYNWTEFSRPLRAVISFVPLIFSLGAAGFLLLTHRRDSGAMEGVALFWTLSIGACIALISQTYHIDGRLETFCLVWSILTLPILYLTRTITPLPIFYGLAIGWASAQQIYGQQSIGLLLLLGAIIPYLVIENRSRNHAGRRAFTQWCSLIAYYIGLGITLEKCLPGLWIPAYAALFSICALIDLRRKPDADNVWLRPAVVFGLFGTIIFSFMLSWTWAWEGIGWNYYRYGRGYNEWAGYLDGGILLVLLSTAICLWVTLKPKSPWRILIAAAPVPALISFLAVSADGSEWGPIIAYNLYLTLLGGGLLSEGLMKRSLVKTNIGLLILCALIFIRFLDSEFGILTRGLVFIALGSGLLVTNVILARIQRRAS